MIITIKTTSLIKNGDKILLIKEWSKKKNGYFWNVVKGTFNPEKDKGLMASAIREAKEEVNLDIIVENILSIFEINKKDGFLLQINFICCSQNGSIPSLSKIYEENEEIIDYKWFNYNEFKLLNESEIMDKRVTMIVDDYFSTQLAQLKCPSSIIKGVN
jgi:ADP-ribose pyrophosphatase YjhB (NUDIX family)